MAPQDTESQFKFLLACIKHSANGKINFGAVAGDLGIVSKAAAAKRYERLLKAHDIVLTPSRGNGEGRARAPAAAKTPKTPRSTTGKRKATQGEEDDSDGLDIKEEEGASGSSPTKKSKVVSALEESDDEFTDYK